MCCASESQSLFKSLGPGRLFQELSLEHELAVWNVRCVHMWFLGNELPSQFSFLLYQMHYGGCCEAVAGVLPQPVPFAKFHLLQ